MRAIFVDAFNQKIEEIDLPIDGEAFMAEVLRLLRTEQWEIYRMNELLIMFVDKLALSKDAPAVWVDVLSEFPIFGNIICVGQHPSTKVIDDLDKTYSLDNFIARWCDKSTTENYKKSVCLN
jgi:hypothetical protein